MSADKAKDSGDAVIQQMLEGTIHDAEQAQKLIDKFTADLEKNDSVDIRRKLADAYMVAEKFEDAFREYETVSKKLGVDDPVLDKQMEKAHTSRLDQIIAELEGRGEQEKAEEVKQQRAQYRADHIFKRAQKFPNDAQLQFDLAELYFEIGDVEQARTMFVKTAEFAQKKRACMVYLGRCALHFQDAAKSIEYLEIALKDMYRMDKYKREALYFLGNAFELAGEKEKAIDCYKKIIPSMPNYRDVPQRLNNLTGGEAPAEASSAE